MARRSELLRRRPCGGEGINSKGREGVRTQRHHQPMDTKPAILDTFIVKYSSPNQPPTKDVPFPTPRRNTRPSRAQPISGSIALSPSNACRRKNAFFEMVVMIPTAPPPPCATTDLQGRREQPSRDTLPANSRSGGGLAIERGRGRIRRIPHSVRQRQTCWGTATLRTETASMVAVGRQSVVSESGQSTKAGTTPASAPVPICRLWVTTIQQHARVCALG